jgi:hypothetical protein
MKMVLVLNIPDDATHTAVALEERVSSSVRHFRDVACVDTSVHRVTLLTDRVYNDNVKTLYGAEPRDHAGWLRRLAKGT